MSDETTQAPEPPKKIRILDLLPEKTPVQTSLGALYVRHIYASDWKHLERNDLEELGKAIVCRLASRFEDKSDDTPLADEDMEALADADFDALAPALAKQCGWGDLPEGPAVKALGQLAKAEKEKIQAQFKKQRDDMRKSVELGYGFLGKSTLDKLSEQLKGMADVREDLRLGLNLDALNNSLLGTDAYMQAMRYSGMSDPLKGMTASNAYDEAVRAARNQRSDILGTQPPLTFHAPDLPRIPRPEETAVGKAAVATSVHTEEIARLMAVLTDATAGLNQTVVTEILPAWFKQVESGTRAGNASLSNAAASLQWAKWAIGLSIVTTIIATWWQISTAQEIDSSNTAQQKAVEATLRERHDSMEALLKRQIAVQEAFIQQQAKEAEQLREAIRSMQKSPAPISPGSQTAVFPKNR